MTEETSHEDTFVEHGRDGRNVQQPSVVGYLTSAQVGFTGGDSVGRTRKISLLVGGIRWSDPNVAFRVFPIESLY